MSAEQRRARILLVAPERVGPHMTAAGIRYFELTEQLRSIHDVTLAAPEGSEPLADEPGFEHYDPARPLTLSRLLGRYDVVFAPPLAPRLLAGAGRRRCPWIVDLLNPEPFEGLEYHKHRPRLERKSLEILRADRITFALRTGTAFVCAGARQKDMWLGYLAACRRLDSDLYLEDPELVGLIDIVPSGVSTHAPTAAQTPVLRGPVFAHDARIVLWNGGIWDWFDPLTVIRAVARLRRADQRWVIAFAGMSRPSNRRPMVMGQRAIAAAEELGLVRDGAVHFNEGWTPYRERGEVLLEADVGVSAHHRTTETRFAYRNRLLDCVWAGLPIVCSDGDELGEAVREQGWGEAVPPGDVDGYAAAMARVADHGRDHYAGALRQGAERRSWQRSADALDAVIARVLMRPSGPKTRLVARGLAVRHGVASKLRRPS